MAIDLPTQLLSYDDYAAIDDGHRYQVVDGVLVMSPSPSTRHQRLSLDLATTLNSFTKQHRLGQVFMAPFDVVLVYERPATVLQPDILFVAKDNPVLTPANVRGAPDLAIELLSPSTAKLDMGRKRALYAEHGVKEFWVIPYEFDRIEVRQLGEGGHFAPAVIYEPGSTLTTPLLPGFELDVESLFASWSGPLEGEP